MNMAIGKEGLSSVEDGTGKMKAALSARQDKNLVIAGRTSALAIVRIDHTANELPGSALILRPCEVALHSDYAKTISGRRAAHTGDRHIQLTPIARDRGIENTAIRSTSEQDLGFPCNH